MKRRFLAWQITFCLIFFLNATVSAAALPTVGVLPFKNDVKGMKAGDFYMNDKEMASDFLITALLDEEKVAITEQAGLVHILEENGLSLTGAINTRLAAKLIPAEYLIVGRVSHLGTKKSHVSYFKKDTGGGGQSFSVLVTLEARIIRVSDGETMRVFTGHGKSRNVGYIGGAKGIIIMFGGYEIAQESLGNAVEKAANDLAKKINAAV